MTSNERLWLNGFTTMSEVLASDELAIAEVRRALEEEDLASAQPCFAPWMDGLEAGIRACFGG